MQGKQIHNTNVVAQDVLATPEEIRRRVPLTERAGQTVVEGRATVERILDRTDHRLLVVVGPCSIHDPVAALDYARRLKALGDELDDTLYLVMRVYFEKPRTTTGWKGLINDPHMNDSFDIEHGLQLARKVLLDINELGLPTGTEALDPISPQYLGDLRAGSRPRSGSRTAPMAACRSPSMRSCRSRDRTASWGSIRRAPSRSSAPAAIATATSCCGADRRARTTTP